MSTAPLSPDELRRLQANLAGEDPGDSLGVLAVDRGWLTAEQLEEAVADRRRHGGPLGQALVRNRYLSAAQLAELLRQRGPAVLGRYQLGEEIGRGGMGCVYVAFDPILKRRVALKVLLEEGLDRQSLRRFEHEAQALARLQHPHIIAVHEAGLESRPPFLAMEYIEGQTLTKAALGLRETIDVLERVARAVAYAHTQGVIHRDLKPGNILIDAEGMPHVADFGLARLKGTQTRLTMTGTVMGTPAYMSPEQVKGESGTIDERADQYAIGAMLYERLTGRVPFEGQTTPEVFLKILEVDPTPPSKIKPGIPRELEAICLKCLQKEPGRRYRGVRELAEDLNRWLTGDPVMARPVSTIYRIRKKLAKRKAVVGVSAAGVGVAAILGLWIWIAEGRARASKEHALLQLQNRTGTALRAALALRREGNVEAMKGFAEETKEVCGEAIERLPEAKEPHYHLGRMYRALMRFAAALEEQEKALRKDPLYRPALYERVVLTTGFLRDRVAELARQAWRDEGERLVRLGGGEVTAGQEIRPPLGDKLIRNDPQARRLRERMETDLRRLGERDPGGGPAIAPGELACVHGLLAWMTGKTLVAHQMLLRAVQEAPLLEEGYEALAMIELERERYEDSIGWRTEGLRRDRGYVPHLEARGLAYANWGNAKLRRGGDPRALYAKAVEDFDEALRLDEGVEARSWRGVMRANWGLYEERRGNEPTRLYEEAERDFVEALRRNPKSVEAMMDIAQTRVIWANWKARRGEDPTALYELAVEDYGKALGEAPDRADAWAGRGLAWMNRATFMQGRGEDPTATYEAAIADFGEALERDPGRQGTWLSRAQTCSNWGVYRAERGIDATALFEAAIADYDEAARRDPEGDEALVGRGRVRAVWGSTRAGRGEDPTTLFRAAIEDFDEALERNPGNDQSWISRAGAYIHWGLHLSGRGMDPREAFEAAIRDFDEVLGRNKELDEAYLNRGLARMNWGTYKATHGEDPIECFESAIEDFGEALSRNPGHDETWKWRGVTRMNLGLALKGAGRDPAPHYAGAIDDFGEALERNPGADEIWMRRGLARMNWGVHTRHLGKDPQEHYRAAIEDFGEALGRNPGRDESWSYRGATFLNWGVYRQLTGQDPVEPYENAIRDLGEALKKNPGRDETLTARALARTNLAIFKADRGESPETLFNEAIEDLDGAIQIDRSNAATWVQRGNALKSWARFKASRSEEASAEYRAALADYTEAVRLDPRMEGRLHASISECLRSQEDY